MFVTYVLYSQKYNKIYIGFTSDLEARMIAHNFKAQKGYTVRFRPWKLVHKEVFETKPEAIKREKELKSAKGRRFVHQFILRSSPT